MGGGGGMMVRFKSFGFSLFFLGVAVNLVVVRVPMVYLLLKKLMTVVVLGLTGLLVDGVPSFVGRVL